MDRNRILGGILGVVTADALGLPESIGEAGLDPADAGTRFLRWYQEGHWTPLGYAYDIGGAPGDGSFRAGGEGDRSGAVWGKG